MLLREQTLHFFHAPPLFLALLLGAVLVQHVGLSHALPLCLFVLVDLRLHVALCAERRLVLDLVHRPRHALVVKHDAIAGATQSSRRHRLFARAALQLTTRQVG